MDINPIVMAYVRCIKRGDKTINDVPEKNGMRERVKDAYKSTYDIEL